VKIEGLEMF